MLNFVKWMVRYVFIMVASTVLACESFTLVADYLDPRWLGVGLLMVMMVLCIVMIDLMFHVYDNDEMTDGIAEWIFRKFYKSC